MVIKAILFYDPECGVPCDDAYESVKKATGAGEVERMELSEGLKKYELGTPEGVPFIGFISEATGKCLNKAFFHDEDGNLVIQRYPSIADQKIEAKPAADLPAEEEADEE